MTLGVALQKHEDLDAPRPQLRALTEDDLMRSACRDLVRWEPCACGGVLEQLKGQDVADVVVAHNWTERHQAWSAQTRWA